MSDKKITVTTAPKNRIVVTKGGGYSTIDTLVELRDVSAANVINDDVLVYVAANGNFVFKEVPFVNAAFTKANAANVLAYTVGINANAYTNAVGFSGNSYSILVGASSNAWANSVGIGGNNYSNAVGIVGNNFTISVGTAGNNFALYLGYSSNSWANTIGISGNNYSNTIGVAGNNYTNAVGVAGNNYTNLVGASANAWANALVFSANSNAGFMANAANARANSVGVAGNNYTNAVGIAGNNYTNAVGLSGNNYTNAVGVAGNNYTNAVGVAGNNYTVFVGASSNAWANSVNVYSDATYFKKSGGTVSGSVSIVGNFGITGNLSVTGNTYFISTDNYRVSDPLIYLAGNNYTSDIVDIGFIANYVNTTGANVHTGLYREHENKEWYLFQGYDKEPDNNHIGALSNNMTLAILNADLRTSNLILGGTNAISWISSAFSKANNALANTSGVSFAGDLTIPGKLYITNENVDALRTRFISGKASGSTANGSLYLNYDYNDPVRVGSGTVRTDFYVANGNVGIGTSAPSSTLHVIGTANITSSVTASDYNSSTTGYKISGTQVLYYSGGVTYLNDLGGGIGLRTASTTRLFIDTSGNVGIGTSSPSSKLQVNGTVTIANTGLVESFRSGANTINLNMYNEANGTLSWEGSAGQLFSITNDLSGSLFTVNDVSGIPSIEVDALGNVDLAPFGGNVGIGTSNPVFKLDVNGDARITGNLTLGDATTDTITVNAANFNLANNISFDSGTLFIDKNNDRIGIGTTSPAYKLDVVGIVNTSDQFRSIGTGGDFRFNGGFGGTVAALGTVDNKPFMMFTNNTERMRIDATGNVGIGTTSPSVPLQIVKNVGDAIQVSFYDGTGGGNRRIEFNPYSNRITAGVGGSYYTSLNFMLRGFYVTDDNTGNQVFNVNNGVARINEIDSGGVAGVAYSPLTLFSNFYPANSTAPAIYLSTFDTGGGAISRMHIYNGDSGKIVLQPTAGNVGIANTAPEARLHVGAANTSSTSGIKVTTRASDDGAVRKGVEVVPTGGPNSLYYGFYADVVGHSTNYGLYINNGDAYIKGYTQVLSNAQIVGNRDSNIGTLRIGDTTSGSGAGLGGRITFWGDTVGQGSARNAFAGIRGVKENSTYFNLLGALIFETQTDNSTGDGTTLTEKMRITSNGNVGIGTTSPAAKLDITGGTSTSNTTSLLNLTQTWNSSGNTFTAIQANITDTASASASKLIDLQVAGNTKFKVEKSGDIYIAHSRKIESYPDPYNNYTSIDFGAQGSASMAFYQNGTPATAFRWNDAVPGVRLISTNSLNWSSTGNAAQAADLAIWRDGSNILAQRFGTSAQTFRLYGTYTDSSNYERLSFFANSTAAYIQTQNGGTGTARPLYLGANNLVAMSIDASGNVGIGTAAPTAIFHVNAGANGALLSATGPTGGTAYPLDVYGNLSAAALVRVRFGTAANFFANNSYIETQTLTATTSDMRFGTSGNERMRVTGAGNVGIGTTSPVYKLDVAGTINALSTAGDANGLKVTATAGYDSWINLYRQGYVNWYLGTFNNSTRLDIRNDSLTAMSIAGSTGHVGINTISPKALLDVKPLSTSNTFSMVLSSGQNVDGFASLKYVAGYAHNDLLLGNFQDASGYSQTAISFGYTSDPARKLHIGSANNSTFDNSSSFVPAVTVTSGGRVGIGTTTPTDKLTVSSGHLRIDSGYCFGHTPSTQTFSYDSKTMGSYSIGWFSDSWNSQGSTAWIAGYGGIKLFTGNALAVAISNTASVGIGTTSPSANLHVIGTANVSSTIYTRDIEAPFYSLYNEGAGVYVGIKGNYLRFGGVSEFMRIANTSGYVGIGTTAPAYRLDVTPTSNEVGLHLAPTTGYDTGFYITSHANNDTVIGSGAAYVSAQFVAKASSAEIIDLYNGGYYFYGDTGLTPGSVYSPTMRMVLDSSGRLGIGTTSPSARLHVNNGNFLLNKQYVGGESQAALTVLHSNVAHQGISYDVALLQSDDAPGLRIVETNTVGNFNRTAELTLCAGDGYANNFAPASIIGSNAALIFATGRAVGSYAYDTTGERMRITSAGNVGIGTSAPQDALQVVGGIRLSSALRDSNYTTNLLNLGTNVGGQVQLQCTSDILFDIASNAGNFIFRTGSSISTKITITNSGNLGIGTTTPSARLHANTSSGTIAQFTGGSDSGVIFGAGGLIGFTDPAGTNGFIFNSASNYAYTQTNGLERMRVTGAGNVGIGTATPGATLDIKNDTLSAKILQLTGNSTYLHYFSTETNSVGTNGNRLKLQTQSAQGEFIYATNVGTRFIIDANGNIGVGTTSPTPVGSSATLSINSATAGASGILVHQYNGAQIARSGVLSGYYTIQDLGSTNGLMIDEQSALPILFRTNATERMRIDSSGNVGIGTAAPQTLLDVAGSDNNGIQYRTATRWISIGSSGGLSTVASGSGTEMVFSVGSERMRIDANGNIGIGTTAPAEKLHIANGSILLDRTYHLKSRDDLGTVRQLIGTSADGTVNVRGFRGTSMMDGVNGATYLYDSGGVGTQRLSVTATGVGIGGILAGAERLEVNGNVKANSYIMANSAIAPITVVTTTTANQIIDSFANTTWRSAQYNITMTSNTDYHTTQISLIHDGANAYITEYGTLSTANDLGSFSATVTSGTVRLNVVPTFANTTINMLRTTNK